MTTIQQKIADAFAPRSCGADAPGQPMRVHLFQVPSDRLRDKAREFVTVAVSLVQVPSYHERLVEHVAGAVQRGEAELAALLERLPEWKSQGFKLLLEPDMRYEVDHIAAMADEREEGAKREQEAASTESSASSGDGQTGDAGADAG